MTEYKTLRVPEDAYDAAQDAKRDAETWGEFLQRCSDTRPEIREFVEAGSETVEGGDASGGVPDDLREQLDRIEASASTAEDRTGSIQRQLEGMSR